MTAEQFLEEHQNEIAILSDFWSESTPRIILYVMEEDISNRNSKVYVTGTNFDWEFAGQRFDLLASNERNHVNRVLIATYRPIL